MISRVQTTGCSCGRPAFTLVEATISLVIAGVMIIAAMAALTGATRGRSIRDERRTGVHLAQQLMEEIVQSWYQDPDGNPQWGLEAGEAGNGSRALFDDVDDYNGFTESPPKQKSGAAIPGCSGWTRSVVVHRVKPASPDFPIMTETGLKRVTLTVAAPSGATIELRALRSTMGVGEEPPAVDTTFVTSIDVDLVISGGVTRTAANMINRPRAKP